jgi:hypothetical protein
MRPQKSARSLRWTGCDLAGSCPSQKAKPQAAGGALAVSIGRTAGHLGGALGVSIDRTAGHLGDGDNRGRYVAFQMAEVAIPRQMFQEILRLIAELRPQPPPAPA